MSAKIMADVLLKSNAKGNAKLVLITIAYYAHDDGTGARPSLTTITQHTGLSRRTVCAMLDYLNTTEQLVIDSTHGKHGTNLYTIPALGQKLPFQAREKSAPLGQALPLNQIEKEKDLLGAEMPLEQKLPQPAFDPTDPAYQRGRRLMVEAVGEQGAIVQAGALPEIPRVANPPRGQGTYKLGKLCKRGHEYEDTGKTLRRLPSQSCLQCDLERQELKRQAQVKARVAAKPPRVIQLVPTREGRR